MKRLPMKKFFKAILLTLSILIVLQNVSYALSPTSRFRPIKGSEEQLSQLPPAPAQAKTIFPSASDVLKPQKENEPVPISPKKTFTLPYIASEQPGAVVFMPKRDFVQGRPLDTTIIRTTRSAEEVREILKSMPKGVELYIRGHLRGVDGPGSSLDLPEFQVKLTPQGNINIEEVPSTPTLASEFSVTVRFKLLPDEKDRDVIGYVAPDYGINPDNPYRVEGGVRLNPATKDTPWETTPKGQLDAPAYIFRNIFGLGGIQIICTDTDAMALAGGMESSNVFNVALTAAASMLSGANLSQAEIVNLAVKLENNEFKGLTGGQGHLCCMMGGAWRHLWLSGMTDGSGKLINPYSALSIPFLSEEHFDAIEDHMFIVQAGKEYESGRARIKRTATLINYMWTDLLRYGDPEGVNLHRQKIALSAQYTKALQDGNFEDAVTTVNRYVDIRDALCRRWLGLVIDYYLGRDVPDYVKTYFVPKVFDKSNEYYEFYDVVRNVIKNMDAYKKIGRTGYTEESARSISFYTYEGIGVLIKEARKEGIAIMPLGAGGPGSNLIALSPNGSAHLRKFLESQGIEQFTPEKADEAKKLIRGLTPSGEIKGYMPFKIGREPLLINGFDHLEGVRLPEGPIPLERNRACPDLSSPALPIKNVSKKNEPVPIYPDAPAQAETTKLVMELKDIKKSLREKLFAMESAREALVKILDEIIKKELSPNGFIESGERITLIKKLHSKLTRANNPEDQKSIIAKVNFTMGAVRRIISKMQNKVKDDEMKDILGMQRRYDEIRNELVKENKGLVRMVVNGYLRKLGKKREKANDLSDELFQDELSQAGNIGLISAIEGFDPGQGFEFSTYAVTAIKRGIQRMLKQRLVEIPDYLWKEKSEIDEFIAKFIQIEKREPTVEEVAAGLNLPVSRVEKIFRAFKKTVSLENPFGEEDEESPASRLEYPSGRKMKPPSEDALILKEKLGQALLGLNKREKKIIKLRYGLDNTLEEVGKILNLSRERVRQIERVALEKLRSHLQPKGSNPLSRKDTNKQIKPADSPIKNVSKENEPVPISPELGFQNIAAVIMAASELKKLIMDKNTRESDIYTKIGELNKGFESSINGEIEIEKKIETVAFKCSGKEYKYAVFHFKKEDKTINVLFLEDHAALTPAELAELRIQDIEKRHLDCPGLEGVWFINSDTANAKSAAEFEKLLSRDALEKEINRIHNENFKYIPDIPEKTILCHIIVDSILPEGQRAMLKTLEQNMRDQSYSEKVVSLTVNKPDKFIDQLRALMARQRELYKDYTVNFDVACPNTDLVAAILGANLGIKALAFEPCKEADVAQVEGIILALRALNSGNIETLREAFKILTGKELPQGLSVISDINELIKRITFILPAAKVIDYSRMIRLNEIIRKNIEAAA